MKQSLILAGAMTMMASGAAVAETISCPHDQIRREVTTNLPDGWWNTPIVNSLQDTQVTEIGGKTALQCIYGSAGRIQRNAPDGASCTATNTGFSCLSACESFVQGKIAWNYNGGNRWGQANLDRLCAGAATSTQPGVCFNTAMHGGVNWGGSTKWKWENAIDLCEGSTNAVATIQCFKNKISAGDQWSAAISACS